MTIRITVQSKQDGAGQRVIHAAAALGIQTLTACRVAHLYFLAENPGATAINRLCTLLLADPVTETAAWVDLADHAPLQSNSTFVVEVAPRPGVTDVAARELARGMVEIGLPACPVTTAMRYEFAGALSAEQLQRLARQLLCNETVQHYSLGPIAPQFGQTSSAGRGHVEQIPLIELDDEQLTALSRRRLLSLDLAEMRTIQAFYTAAEREPTDVELETLAQTWCDW